MKIGKYMLFAAIGMSLVSQTEAAPGQQRRKPQPKNSYGGYYDSVPAAPAAVAPTEHKMAGCGLGSLVIQDGTKWSQVLAATLNGTGVQTIGMTFGTSNCTEDGVVAAVHEKAAFMEANSADLRKDIAVGQGEYLSSLASLYGCKGEAVANFSKAVHGHSGALMSLDAPSTLKHIDGIISQDAMLKSACGA